jgi:hypothetical protein
MKNYIKHLLREGLNLNECPPININNDMVIEASKFNNDEDFIRSGGFSIEALDRAAFGFSSDDIKTISPKDLRVKWKDDYDNVIWEINKSGLPKKQWAEKINLNEPIDVVFEKDKFFIEDGHHRFVAAKILKKNLNVNLEIKTNPIIKLTKGLGYDDFTRCAFNQIKNKGKF